MSRIADMHSDFLEGSTPSVTWEERATMVAAHLELDPTPEVHDELASLVVQREALLQTQREIQEMEAGLREIEA